MRNHLQRAKDPSLGYEEPFLQHIRLASEEIKHHRPKILTNAGALNPKGCAEAVTRLFSELGIEDMKVAYVEGDDLLPRLSELEAQGEDFHHLEDSSRALSSWGLKPASANAYVGARGIYEALKAGADVVISGRCTDASPLIAAAAWHHQWTWEQYDELAGALLAGHCIECGGYVTGGNSSGFLNIGPYYDLTMGIAEIERDGTFTITKQTGYNGAVNADTVRSQILYEIQGNVSTVPPPSRPHFAYPPRYACAHEGRTERGISLSRLTPCCRSHMLTLNSDLPEPRRPGGHPLHPSRRPRQ